MPKISLAHTSPKKLRLTPPPTTTLIATNLRYLLRPFVPLSLSPTKKSGKQGNKSLFKQTKPKKEKIDVEFE